MLRFLSGGESHGKCLVGIIEGLPSNLEIDINKINKELSRRQKGYGRGGRMKIEKDKVEILSGIRGGKTIGSPVSLLIKNRDWENWKEVMSIIDNIDNDKKVNSPRPGHGDLAGAVKYNQTDIRNILERASARETAMRVAIGSIAKQLLKKFDIYIYSHVLEIGNVRINARKVSIEQLQKIDESPLRVIDKETENKIIKKIDEAKKQGDTLGGIFELIAVNVPIGLGSHVNWDRKLDGIIAQAIMSIQGIKGVEIGLGFESSRTLGSQVHDEIYYNGQYYRKTNNAGGIEAGITNGNNIVVRAAMKPIPTLSRPLDSVDMITKQNTKAQKERSDVCAVPSASIVGENVLAWVLAKEFVNKFGGDSIEEMLSNYKRYIQYVDKR
ncbi:chorismate synthase [Caldisalinibacter kiritimatiensis]|uniref:Chorismate synthase n=1 Tax=Caldisalinibacter kiritimatiensis TaxID=1304284 RepID=R1CXJ7_9FIRM|nr:chorismate synthase [Caldisalinibacter kiritimatiensis]EOD01339.1 Chorismate synthase [Caldisalinibacter kiritimatiensis]